MSAWPYRKDYRGYTVEYDDPFSVFGDVASIYQGGKFITCVQRDCVERHIDGLIDPMVAHYDMIIGLLALFVTFSPILFLIYLGLTKA